MAVDSCLALLRLHKINLLRPVYGVIGPLQKRAKERAKSPSWRDGVDHHL
jgi:hypothetical protein